MSIVINKKNLGVTTLTVENYKNKLKISEDISKKIKWKNQRYDVKVKSTWLNRKKEKEN